MANHRHRRNFLKSGSAFIALPSLESFAGRPVSGRELQSAPPKRMIFLSMGFGVTKETWFPNANTTGADYELPDGLKPLLPHKQDITLVQNLANQYSNEAHWGSTFYLTGANRYAEPGQSFHNSISADQIAAEVFGRETRFTSLQLNSKDAKSSGHGPGLSLAWNRQGKPIAGVDTPVALFHKLFSDDSTPLVQRQAELQRRRSVMDTVLEDAKSFGRGLNKTDTAKLSEYYQSIRDIETRLSKEEQWLDIPKRHPQSAMDEPGTVTGHEEVKLMYDLMVAAMQVDATRVFTYRLPTEAFIKSLGASISAHNMSHYTEGTRKQVSQSRDRKHAELLAYFIDRLKTTKEPDGSSLFDHVSLSFGSNINSLHYLHNCPTLLTGGGAGVIHGKHIVTKKDTPLCNLWLSLLRGSGLRVESHGDSDGVIEELFL